MGAGSISTSAAGLEPSGSEPSLEQELQQARLRQTQVQTQLEAQLLKRSKGPGAFRKVMGAIAGGAASLVAPGLGGAISNMIVGGYGSATTISSPGLNALPSPEETVGLDAITKSMQDNAAAMQKLVASGIQYNQDEIAKIASLPKGPDPVAFLALAEKTNEQSEIFQATSAVAKAKHEAAMAAIQNIKD